MLTKRELFESIAFFVVVKAYEAANDTEVYIAVPICDNSHLDEVRRVHTLLQHIVYAVLSQGFHSHLMLIDLFLDIGHGIVINFTCHLLVILDASQELQSSLFDRRRLFDLGPSVKNQTHVTEDKHV